MICLTSSSFCLDERLICSKTEKICLEEQVLCLRYKEDDQFCEEEVQACVSAVEIC